MRRFKAREIHILVSTTVIEVGIDVANASVMLVEHAERFGLSQLHQLRGRVGRGPWKSVCILLTSGRLTEEAKRRIDAMVATNDGFKIAEVDLELRGPRRVLRHRQSGLPEFRTADLLRGRRRPRGGAPEAQAIIAADPELREPAHGALRASLLSRWRGKARARQRGLSGRVRVIAGSLKGRRPRRPARRHDSPDRRPGPHRAHGHPDAVASGRARARPLRRAGGVLRGARRGRPGRDFVEHEARAAPALDANIAARRRRTRTAGHGVRVSMSAMRTWSPVGRVVAPRGTTRRRPLREARDDAHAPAQPALASASLPRHRTGGSRAGRRAPARGARGRRR